MTKSWLTSKKGEAAHQTVPVLALVITLASLSALAVCRTLGWISLRIAG